MKKILFISFFLLIISACSSSRQSSETTSAHYKELFHEGIRFMTKDQDDKAIIVFESCTSENPFDDAPWFALSKIYSEKKENIKAINCLKKAIKLDPSNTYYEELIASTNYEIGNHKEAISNYAKILKKNPENAEWLFNLSDAYLKNNELEKSIATIVKLEKLIGESPEIGLEKYKLLRELSQNKKAEEVLKETLMLFPSNKVILSELIQFYIENKRENEAFTFLKTFQKSHQENGTVLIMLAEFYKKRTQEKELFETLEDVFIHEDVSLEEKAKYLLYFTENYNSEKDLQVSKLIQLFIEKYPREAQSHTLNGDYLLKKKLKKEALKAYKEALAYDEKKFALWEQVNILEYDLQLYEALYEDGKKAIELFPSQQQLYLMTGIACNQLSKYYEGLEILNLGKIFVIRNNHLKAEFYGQIGYSHFKLKNISEAIENFDKCIELNPENELNLNNYAYFLANEKIALDKAEKMIKKALQLKQNEPHFLDTYGWILFQKENYIEALNQFNLSVQLKYDEPAVFEHLGDCFSKLGNEEKASLNWKTAQKLGSKSLTLEKKIQHVK